MKKEKEIDLGEEESIIEKEPEIEEPEIEEPEMDIEFPEKPEMPDMPEIPETED